MFSMISTYYAPEFMIVHIDGSQFYRTSTTVHNWYYTSVRHATIQLCDRFNQWTVVQAAMIPNDTMS